MAGETPITFIGNIVAEPELRFTPTGKPVCNFRVASTPRYYDRQTGQWEDGEATFLTCNDWACAENSANTLAKGMRVIVQGTLNQRRYQNREGENRTVYEINVHDVGPSLKFATAQVNKNPKGGQQGYNGQQQGQQAANGYNGQQQGQNGAQQPTGGFGQQSQQQQSGDPWANAPASVGQQSDEPPF